MSNDCKLNVIIFLLVGFIVMMGFCTLNILDTIDDNSENMINACSNTLGTE